MSDSIEDKMIPAGASERELPIILLKGTIATIPFVGTLLNELLFEGRSRLKQERLNGFFIEVAEDVRRLQEESVNHDFVQSDAFGDLIEDLCIRVSRTQSEEKRARFRRILLGAVQGKHDADFSAHFLAMLSEMSEAELSILVRGPFNSFLEQKLEFEARGEKLMMAPFDYEATQWGCDAMTVRQLVQSLIARGLLYDNSASVIGFTPFSRILPTDLAARFFSWLEADPKK